MTICYKLTDDLLVLIVDHGGLLLVLKFEALLQSTDHYLITFSLFATKIVCIGTIKKKNLVLLLE